MIKAVIFDLDGVIVNSEPLYEEITAKMMKEVYGIELSDEIIKQIKGMREADEFKWFIQLYGLDATVEEMTDNRDKYFF